MKTVPRYGVVALLVGTFVVFLALAVTGVIGEGPQETLLLLAPLL